jgi:hypothetical protein
MSKPAKPAAVHYYIDADVLGLAKILVQVRPDVTYPGDPGGTTRTGGYGHLVPSPIPILTTTYGFQRLPARDG